MQQTTKKSNKKVIIIVGVCAIIVLVSVAWRSISHKDNAPAGKVASHEDQTPPEQFYALNGVSVEKELSLFRPVGIIVENHPDSRPQTGLDKADIVYETVAEGGITRFLAIYQTAKEATIGPVRSARDYFSELASEYGAVFAHVGGSDEALANLAAKRYVGVDDANEYFQEKSFGRIKNRPAPHNVYTTLQKLRDLMIDKKWSSSLSATPWKFTNAPVAGVESASQVVINFSTPSFGTRYEYDPASGLYKRFIAGVAHIDAETKQQIAVKTIIAQMVTVNAIPNDPKLRVDVDLKTGGVAMIFYDGHVTHAKWKKENNRTRYYTTEGTEIELPRGNIWVAITPNDGNNISWK